MLEGTIKKKFDDKGYGFIEREHGYDIFFHATACGGKFEDLREGQKVTFNEGKGPKGPRAENVESA